MVFRKISYLIILVFVGISFFKCSKDNPTELKKSAQYLMPLDKGNTWNYRSIYIDNDTTESLFTFKVSGEIIINGQKYAILDSNSIARNDNSGLIIAGYNYNDDRIYDDIFFKYPVKEGEVYSYTPLDEKEGTFKLKVSIGNISVHAGNFSCYIYKFIDENEQEIFPFFYLSPGIGLIKIELEANGKEEIELISYEIK